MKSFSTCLSLIKCSPYFNLMSIINFLLINTKKHHKYFYTINYRNHHNLSIAIIMFQIILEHELRPLIINFHFIQNHIEIVHYQINLKIKQIIH